MNVTYRVDKDILYIAIEGRIDATNAAEAEEKIFSIKNENPEKHYKNHKSTIEKWIIQDKERKAI